MLKTNSDQWNFEYKKKGIPSSFRSDPSGSVEYFLNFILKEYVKANTATKYKGLDIGCGTGRNSFFLSEKGFSMTAIDFLEVNIENIKANSKDIRAICHDVSKKWPFEAEEFDFALDTFCYKHQIPEEDKINYISELQRTIKNGGLLLLTLAGVDDGYYKMFLKNSPDRGRNVIIDPKNNIPSILYTKDQIIKEFSNFALVDYVHKQKKSLMHSREYLRSTHLFIFEKL